MAHGKFLYYSTSTRLSYRITKRYFGGHFYVYCTEDYDPEVTNPHLSSLAALYQYYRAVAEGDDRGSDKVFALRSKLKEAGLHRRDNGEIAQASYDALAWEADNSHSRDFAPILYLIRRDAVRDRLQEVTVDKRANPDSIEYIIDGLREEEFELIVSRIRLVGGI